MMPDTSDQAIEATSTWESYQLNGYNGSSSEKDRVEHDYHDHSKDKDFQELYPPGMTFHLFPNILGGRGPEQTFPMKLHAMLEQIEKDGLASVVSWQTHGRCFVVHKPEEFVAHILPRWFRQSKFPSFQRQLNMYGFKRITSGRDKGGYYHELFLRERKFLCLRIQRLKIKGTGVRKPSSPETEPDFYHMKFLPALGSKEQLRMNPMVLIDPGEMNAAPLMQQRSVASSQIPACPPMNVWGPIPPLSTQQEPSMDSEGPPCPPAHVWLQDQQKAHGPLPVQDYWSFCEPRPMAEIAAATHPLLVPCNAMAAITSNVSEQKEPCSKSLPSPPDFSIADAFKNSLKPVMPFAQAVIQATCPPPYFSATFAKPQSSPVPLEDDLDCQFDFDEAMESLLKIPMPSTLPSEMMAPPQAYPVKSTEA